MTTEFKFLMHITGKIAQEGEIKSPVDNINWAKLMFLAKEQSVFNIVAYALKNSKDMNCPEQLRQVFLRQMTSSVLQNLARKEQIIKLFDELELNNIHATLLKGDVLAKEYARPELRESIDTDILVAIEDEEKVYEILKNFGCSIHVKTKTSHHGVCFHEIMRCIEIHTALYDDIIENEWFHLEGNEKIISERMINNKEGFFCYNSFSDTDNMIFITLHMIKHFILSGINLKMILDIALFYKNNYKNIDNNRFWRILDQLQYSEFVKCVLYIARSYMNIELIISFGVDSELLEKVRKIIDDIEEKINEEENSVNNYYLYSANNRRLLYYRHILIRNLIIIKDTFTPKKNTLKFRYAKEVDSMGEFLTYLYRIGKRIGKLFKKLKTNKNRRVSFNNSNRIYFIEELGMLHKNDN